MEGLGKRARCSPTSRPFSEPRYEPRHSRCSALPARSRRASPFGLALPPAVLWRGAAVSHFFAIGYEWRGAEKGATWGVVDAASDNPQDSNHHGLARATRLGLPGPGPQVLPTRSASRAVRCSPVSRLFTRPACRSTQENGSRWAAQRLGRRLAVCRRVLPWRLGPSREHARREPFSGGAVPSQGSRVALRRAPVTTTSGYACPVRRA